MRLSARAAKLFVTFIVSCSALAPFSSVIAHELPKGIETSLRLYGSKFSPEEPVSAEISYKNTTSSAIKLLKWGTALEGRLNEDVLQIRIDGEEVPYIGRHYKRAAPLSSDYVLVLPDASVSSRVDLSEAYGINFKGEYQIALRPIHNPAAPNYRNITFKLNGDRAIAFKSNSFDSSCTASFLGLSNRPALIDQAHSTAISMATSARDYLRDTPAGLRPYAPRYEEWFGAFSQARWDAVQSNFNTLLSAAQNSLLQFRCDDDDPNFAYVFQSQPYIIYLGREFWRRGGSSFGPTTPNTGTDSRGGTIVHELSHFFVVAGTADIRYGQSACRALADSSPSQAINNADSYEYFAENTPFLVRPELDLEAGEFEVEGRRPVELIARVINNGNILSPPIELNIMLSEDSEIQANDTVINTRALPRYGIGTTSEIRILLDNENLAGGKWLGFCLDVIEGEDNANNNCSNSKPVPSENLTFLPLLLDEE